MQQVLFFIPPDCNSHSLWDGKSIRTGGCGASGSHQSFVIAAEQFKRLNLAERIYFYNYCNKCTYNGVHYINDIMEVCSNIDTIIVPSWYGNSPKSYNLENTFPKLKKILVWFQCHPLKEYLVNIILSLNRTIEVTFIHVSQWSKTIVMKQAIEQLKERVSHHYVLPNALMSDTLPTVEMINNPLRKNDAIFIASYERGGEVAARVWQRLQKSQPQQWGSFLSSSYCGSGNQRDKQAIFKMCIDARYFIYPLVLSPNSYNSYSVHRDTFACCVAEAIACGVEVLSYRIAALDEYYSDMIHWIPLPETVDINALHNNVDDTQIPELFGDEQVDTIAKMLISLNNTYEQRSKKRMKDAVTVRVLFDMDRVGNAWKTSIDKSYVSELTNKNIEIGNVKNHIIHMKSKRGHIL